jgi:hypothetical protein
LLQLVDEFLDLDRGDGVERGAGLVHEDDSGSTAMARAMHKALLLAAGEAERAGVQAVADFVPQGGAAQAALDRFVEAGLVLMPCRRRP